MCMGCGVFLDDFPPGGKVLCEKCQERGTVAEERRERKARIVGRQPLICAQCSEPFLASRLGHVYCSSTCRWRAWQARRLAAV
jgi:hypothetical protein